MKAHRFGLNLEVDSTSSGLKVTYGAQWYGRKTIIIHSAKTSSIPYGIIEVMADIIHGYLQHGILIDIDGPEEGETFAKLLNSL